jgi:gliding motility-associated-like protein
MRRANINVVVKITPAAPIVAPRLYCQNTTATALTAIGTNLLWYTAATGGVGSTTAPTPSTLVAGVITYYVTQTTVGCESPRAALAVTVTATPTAPTVVSPINYCPGQVAVPLAANGTNLLWYTTATGGVGSTTAPTPSTNTLGTVSYYVSQSTPVATGACESPRAEIKVVTVNNGLTMSIVPADTTICEGNSLKIEPTVTPEATTYEWRAIGVPATTISSIDTKITTVSPVDTATYILRATRNGCYSERQIKVNVIWKPKINAGKTVAICFNDSVLLRPVLIHKSSDSINFYWSPIDSLRTPNELNTWILPKLSTWYTIKYVTKPTYGCDFTDSSRVKVVVQPKVIAFAGNDTIAVKGIPHKLHGRGGINYTWSSPAGIAITNPFSEYAFVTLNSDANIALKVTDAIGCEGYDNIFIKVYDGPTYYVPNTFSPNGDGLNDVFRPIAVGISTTLYFRVFNRFGELMFESNQWLKGWDGTFKGQQQTNGTYVWMLSGVDKDNKKVEMKGNVNLLR